ncbi:PilZ domain-containing protein [Maricurvus nonylphenolicus]|uniref:PilZ domain-containing protein n=1 Tax=Maricurvus nonylphenolicus TaxID=1008307 RepID=UPI0036F2048C
MSEIDLRREPRFKTNFSCSVDTPDQHSEAVITNLSMSGLQLECDHGLMQALMPNIKRPSPHQPISLAVHFEVPTSYKDKDAIDLHCKIIYSRRLAQDKFVIGCMFSEFEHQCETVLEDYLQHFGERI